MIPRPQFVFITCQVGAEAAVKGELARLWPAFRLAYSRPGFLTFKLPEGHLLPDDFDLHLAFARAYGFSLGKATAEEPEALARETWKIWGDRPVDRLHVWERDQVPAGEHGYEPDLVPADFEAAQLLRRVCPQAEPLPEAAVDLKRPAKRGEMVLDCVRVEPNQWWIGYHKVHSFASQWPGGMVPLDLPPDAVSRAWLKMEEALRWSQLPLKPGDHCAEIGSAPGGASQALLRRGLRVMGIDPAEMDPAVLANPNFTHVRRKANQVRRREYRNIRWLTVDMNVAPNYTLDVVEDIVMREDAKVRGMLLTLKLFEWTLADDLPAYLERIRGWGYDNLRARQLQHNRQELAVVALASG